jgi:hypothetical protein
VTSKARAGSSVVMWSDALFPFAVKEMILLGHVDMSAVLISYRTNSDRGICKVFTVSAG